MINTNIATPGREAPMAFMPQSAADQKILQQRADALAQEETTFSDEERRESYVRFRVGAVEQYGIPARHIEEIGQYAQLARVPGVPDPIAGVVNRRGELLTVLNLRTFFRTEPADFDEESRVIVVSGGVMTLGIRVNEVEGLSEYRVSELSPPLPSSGVENFDLVLGVHNGNVTIINVDALLNEPALIVNQCTE